MKNSIIKLLLLSMCSLLLLMGGCSATRLAYNNAPQLTWWWIDGYFEFDRNQSPPTRKGIDQWFEWHRGSQLTEYATLLAQAQPQVLEPLSAAQVCRWQERIRTSLEPALQRAVLEFAEILPTFTEAQFKQLEKRQAKGTEDLRKNFVQPDTAERTRESFKRTLERAERVYGDLDEAQKKVLQAGLSVSPFSPELWMVERQRRQRDTVQTLRRLVSDKADRETRVAALKALMLRNEQSPEPNYRALQIKLTDFNCGLLAQLHATTSAAQKQKARSNLKGWEEDLRYLAAQTPG